MQRHPIADSYGGALRLLFDGVLTVPDQIDAVQWKHKNSAVGGLTPRFVAKIKFEGKRKSNSSNLSAWPQKLAYPARET
jgi:hypothetical protein